MVDTGGLGEEWFDRSHLVDPGSLATAETNDVVELVTSSMEWLEMEETLEVVEQGRVECMSLFIKPAPSLFFKLGSDQSLTANNVCSNRNTRF